MTLNEQQIKDLYAFIDEIPTKYGIPLLNFFNKIHEEQKVNEEMSKENLSAPEIISKIKEEQK